MKHKTKLKAQFIDTIFGVKFETEGVGPKTLRLPVLGKDEAQNVKLEAQFSDTIFRGKFEIEVIS